jgi:hypothetical protein
MDGGVVLLLTGHLEEGDGIVGLSGEVRQREHHAFE